MRSNLRSLAVLVVAAAIIAGAARHAHAQAPPLPTADARARPTTTASGLSYVVVEDGAGPAAQRGQHVLIHETTSFEDGRVYFTTNGRKPLRFLLGGNQVIAGVDEGVTGMRVGERRTMVVPPSLSFRSAYPDGLPPDATLHYDVTLVAIEPVDSVARGSAVARLQDLETRLLEARRIRLAFEVNATGAMSADLRGHLDLARDGDVSLSATGTFGGTPLDVSLHATDATLLLTRDREPQSLTRPSHLAEALVIGLTRMGILHNLARLAAARPPDHADGGVRDWVTVSDRTTSDTAGSIALAIAVAGQPAGDATLTLDAKGHPAVRHQTVQFPGGEMRVVERYAEVSIDETATAASNQAQSAAYSAPYQRKTLEIYRTLVGMRTAADQGQVPKAAAYLSDQFRAAGFPADDVHVLPFTVASGEETAGLVVRYRGDGSSGRKPILLLAHMDVVDARREDWERDPFTLIEENGYFFGRGSLDNKFGVASLTGTFLRLKADGFVPTRDLIIAFTGDEETGMLSARRLVNEHRALTDAEFALNDDGGGGKLDESGKPVAFFVQTAEKTYATFELTLTNPGGHSSTPRADDNAIYDLSRALSRLEAHRFPVQTTDATRLFFREMAKVTPGPVGEAMSKLAFDPADESAADVLWRESELVGITRTTCVPTLLRAGHAENALPQSAVATVNCRIFPGVEVAEVQRTLERIADTPGLVVTVLATPMASPASPLRDDVMDAVSAAVHARYPGTPIIPYMAPYGTDGKETRAAGIPTYGVMGLFIKDADQFAHGLNERVEVAQFFGALEHWKVLLTRLAGRPGA